MSKRRGFVFQAAADVCKSRIGQILLRELLDRYNDPQHPVTVGEVVSELQSLALREAGE